MKIKDGIIITDYDGTIKSNPYANFENSLFAMKEILENESLIMISTGRLPESMIVENERFGLPFSFLSCGNGNVLFDENYNVLFKETIDSHIIQVLKPFYKNILSLEMLDEFGNPSNEKHLECCIILDNVAKEERRKIIHVLYYSNIYDYCTDGENKYKIHIFKRSNKIKTIEELNLMLHNETIPIFTLGDGVNDLEMIKQYNGFFITNTMKEYRDYSLGEYDSISSLIGDIQLKKVRRR